MKATEMVTRRYEIQAEHDTKLMELNQDVAKLNCSVSCENHEIYFIVNKSDNPYFPVDPLKYHHWSYSVKVTKNDYGTIRNRDWMDLPKNVKRYIKVFYKIGDKWLLDALDLNWPEQLKTERENIARLNEWERVLVEEKLIQL